MLQAIYRSDLYRIRVDALVGGQQIGLTGYEIDRELPDPYSTSPTYTAASGGLTGLGGEEVTRTVPTPWDANTQWPPVGETAVEVSMDVGAGPVVSMTQGKVLGSDGSSTTREVEVEFSDRYQTLDRTISWDTVKASMPAHDRYGWDWTKNRYVSMLTSAVTDMIFRHCGWYATPPKIGYTSLSVPAMGTMWPEAGQVLEAGRAERGYPTWAPTSWGVGVVDFVGGYQLAGAYSVKSRGRMEMCVLTEMQPSYSRINVQTATGAGQYRLQWTNTQGQLYVRAPDGAYRQAATVSRVNGKLLYATVEYVSDTQVRCTLRCGDNVTGPVLYDCDPIATTSVCSEAWFTIQGDSGAFQIAFPSTSGNLVGWTPNAQIHPRSGNRNHLFILPHVEGENCLDLLRDQAKAEAGTFWIDEHGILQWWDLQRLETADTVATLGSADDITDEGFSWAHDSSAVKSRVSVKWKDTAAQWHPEYTITAWQGTGETLQAGGETSTYWIKPENDDILWVMVDTALQRVGTNAMLPFNQGIGSWYGGILPGRTEEEPDQWAYGTGPGTGSMLMSLEHVTDGAFKASIQWTGEREAVQKTPDFGVSSAMWRVRYNMDLPLIRCKAIVEFTDQLTYSTIEGPPTAPEHELDTGWWIQTAAQAQYIADRVAERVTLPQPVLSSINLAPRPGLQLGDVVEVYENRVLRATVRGIVLGDSRKIQAKDGSITFSQAVTVRPSSITLNGVTWQEWSKFIRPLTWQAWAGTQTGETWQQWGEAPLE